jgi:predicted RNA-binding Zn-ribbon protein involved in translation (DUF1610 family)
MDRVRTDWAWTEADIWAEAAIARTEAGDVWTEAVIARPDAGTAWTEAVTTKAIMSAPRVDFMAESIHFKCRGCEIELEVNAPDAAGYACPDCGQSTHLRTTEAVGAGEAVDMCASCGHDNLYIQKDFNRMLGMAIVVVGVGFSVVLFAMDEPFLAMGALVGMALIDLAIYFLVGSVTVCYACHTIYRGFPPNPDHEPFNLEMLERHGGKDPRH